MKLPTIPHRCQRLMLALLNAPRSREECDRIAPASNSPEYIARLRRSLGLELPCEHVPFVTKDGVSSWYGRYYATTDDKAKIREFLVKYGGPRESPALAATSDEASFLNQPSNDSRKSPPVATDKALAD